MSYTTNTSHPELLFIFHWNGRIFLLSWWPCNKSYICIIWNIQGWEGWQWPKNKCFIMRDWLYTHQPISVWNDCRRNNWNDCGSNNRKPVVFFSFFFLSHFWQQGPRKTTSLSLIAANTLLFLTLICLLIRKESWDILYLIVHCERRQTTHTQSSLGLDFCVPFRASIVCRLILIHIRVWFLFPMYHQWHSLSRCIFFCWYKPKQKH